MRPPAISVRGGAGLRSEALECEVVHDDDALLGAIEAETDFAHLGRSEAGEAIEPHGVALQHGPVSLSFRPKPSIANFTYSTWNGL